ncbi:MAG: AEC family transporter [Hylemonella sp.]
MSHPVFSALVPVVLLVALGYAAARLRWIRVEAGKDLSNLVFLVLTPALMFRTMSGVRVQALDYRPLLAYFAAALLLFGLTLLVQGFNRRAAVLALAASFSNTVMIGVALIGLAYGEAALVVLLTLVSLHALVLLTAATVVLELAYAREQAGGQPRPLWRTVLTAVRNAVIHPVPLPILAGLLYAQSGWVLPEVVDRPLQWLGQAFGPLALLLVGVTLAGTRVGPHLRGALAVTLAKNLLMPALVAGLGLLLGLRGLPLTVMVVAAALPIGANVFIFAQRYAVAEELVTASVIVSNAVALLTLPLVMALVALL